jgi:glutathione S-transferase
MIWVQLITLLAVLQFFAFGGLVARARARYGVKAPATTGHEVFERYYRVQMNTLETLVLFLPSLWIAAQYWSPQWMAAVGAVYLVGRMVYQRGYVAEPRQRHLGYMISITPTLLLFVAGLVGVVKGLVSQ